jgi:hypothetical protein
MLAMFVVMALHCHCMNKTSTTRLKCFEQQHAGWGRQMRRHSSRSDVSRVCLPQLASPRTEGEDKDANKKGLPSKTRSPSIRLLVSAHIASDMSFAQEPIPRFREAVLQTGCCTKCRSFIGSFPSELWLFTAKVAISRGLAVDRAQQVEHLNDAFGAQVKVLGHQC